MGNHVRVIGFDHVVLYCSDVERALTFYCGTLGLEPERAEEWRRGEAPFPSVRVTPTTLIDLFPSQSDVAKLDHLCLVLEPTDLAALAAAFPGSNRVDHVYGAQGYGSSVYVTDPDGNTIELRCYPS